MNVSVLTQEQIVEFLELSRSLKLERDRHERTSCPLPDEIIENRKDAPKAELKANIKSFNGRQSIMREETGQDLERSTRSSSLISRNSTWTLIPLLATSTKTRSDLEQLEKQQPRSFKISSLSSIEEDQRRISNNCRKSLKKSDAPQSTVK